MRKVREMTLGRKLIAVFLVVGALIAATSLVVAIPILRESAKISDFHQPVFQQAQAMQTQTNNAIQKSLAYLVSGETELKASFLEWANGFDGKIDSFRLADKVLIETDVPSAAAFQSVMGQQKLLVSDALLAFREYERDGAVTSDTFEIYQYSVDALEQQFEILINLKQREMLAQQNRALSVFDSSRWTFLLLPFLALTLAGGFGVILARGITAPLRDLETAAREVRAGNLDVSVSNAGRDELGTLSRAFNEMVSGRREVELALQSAKKEAVSASAAKTRFLRAASHDLRQPLQATRMYGAALRRTLIDKKPVEICDKIEASIQSMNELLESLLDISKLEGGSIVPEIEDFSSRSLLNRIVSTNIQQAQQKGLFLKHECDDFALKSDPALLERIIENFTTNAIRYTESGGITITCQVEDGGIMILVRDTGIGMTEETQDQIFEEYYQIDNDARERHMGQGLGLSIVRHISKVLGHPITVQSSLGEGSSFSVLVPEGDVAAIPVAKVVGEANDLSDSEDVKVLLVDDDPAVLESTALLLETMDMTVSGAANHADALKLIAGGFVPDCIVSDYRLPGGNGVEVIRDVRNTTSRLVPAIVVSGDTSAREIEGAGLEDCQIMQKPVDIDALVEVIRTRAH